MSRDRKVIAKSDRTTTSFIEVAISARSSCSASLLDFDPCPAFLSIAIWSAVLTVALYPVFEWTSHQLGGRRRIAAALITFLSLLIIIGPATWPRFGTGRWSPADF